MPADLRILILSDGRPGHYHLSEGVAAAIARKRPVAVTSVTIARRALASPMVLRAMIGAGLPPGLVLTAGYRLATPLPPADLVISAGGHTLAANIAAARHLAVPNIFCGTIRWAPAEAFAAVVSSYEKHSGRPRHIIALKPSRLDPDANLGARSRRPLSRQAPPRTIGLLVGGPSGRFAYQPEEWQHLARLLADVAAKWGTRWVISTSRRTPAAAADLFAGLAGEPYVADVLDFRTAGPGTLARVFSVAEAIVCTADSSTMMSEAVAMRLPVVGVHPIVSDYKGEERDYRAMMEAKGWVRSLALESLDADGLVAALLAVTPMVENPLDHLASALADLVPGLRVPA